MATLVFSEVSARSCHQVLILPDNVPEAAETFAGTLSLSNDVIARGLQGRISLRPDETVVTIAASDQCEWRALHVCACAALHMCACASV